MAQYLLAAGANDVGGTLINESISTSAGAGFGQLVPPAELRRLIREAGRVPARRGTTYDLLKVYATAADDEDSPLDHVTDAAARFGSYRALSTSEPVPLRAPGKDRGPDPLLAPLASSCRCLRARAAGLQSGLVRDDRGHPQWPYRSPSTLRRRIAEWQNP